MPSRSLNSGVLPKPAPGPLARRTGAHSRFANHDPYSVASNRQVKPSASANGHASPPARGRRSRAAESDPGSAARTPFFGYVFRNPELLHLALTHSSLAYESQRDSVQDPGTDNERLEFIGDAVLGLATAEALYHRFPDLREGELTRMRASLVSRRNLAEVAQRINLGPMLRLGRGEEHSGGQRKPALLANALEAVIAAMYLDGGLGSASEFIQRHIVQPAEPMLSGLLHSEVPFSGGVGDFKSALQERLQATGAGQPQYVLAEESGPDHQKRFRIEVRVSAPDGSSVRLAEAEGSSKKQAQQEAARLAFAILATDPEGGLNAPAADHSVETSKQEVDL